MNRISCVGLLALLANLASPAILSAADLQSATAGAQVSRKPARPQQPAPTSAPVIVTTVPGDAQVAFDWTAVPNASGYQIFRSTTGVWAPTPFAQVTGTSYRNEGLTNGATYSYRVVAFNSSGAGPFSNVVAAIPFSASADATPVAGDKTAADFVAREAEHATRDTASAPATSADASRGSATTADSGVPAALMQGVSAPRKTTPQPAASTTSLSGTVTVTAAADTAIAPTPQAPTPQTASLSVPANVAPAARTPGVAANTASPGIAVSAPAVASTTTTVAPAPVVSVTPMAVTISEPASVPTSNPSSPVSDVTPSVGGTVPPAPAEITAVAPAAPQAVSATAGNGTITLVWTPVSGATTYNIYRSLAPGPTVRFVAGLTPASYFDAGLQNGTTYYYKVTAVSAVGESSKSSEVSTSPVAPPAPADPATVAAFRFLRQATWGPKPGDVDLVKNQGASAFLTDQMSAPPSTYPDTLYNMPIEMAQERFMEIALTGSDQLRQRVAWALHKIWVVSANEISSAPGIVTYQRLFLAGAFGNYRDLMRDVSLNPAMGRYLNMLNNKSQAVTGSLPNENYARELMQLFTIGIPRLDQNGTPSVTLLGVPLTTYTEPDVKELARIFTGWTFGDGNPATIPTRAGHENYKVPMEAVANFHDQGAKVFLGHDFPAGQTARQDLDQALDLLFNDPNVGPFVARQLIQQLVTSNPSKAYVAAVAGVFNDNGSGVRGDLAAVVRAVLTHAEAGVATATSGKLSEPALFIASQLRALNATVTDHPFMSDKAEAMGQKVLYPGSVFSYFSPGYKVRGTSGPGSIPLGGPEFQILTAVTALERANFVGSLLAGYFGTDVTIDYTPFNSRAADAVALVDDCSLLFMGGRMSTEARLEIINAVRASSATNVTERVRTALYLTLTSAQFQVDR